MNTMQKGCGEDFACSCCGQVFMADTYSPAGDVCSKCIADSYMTGGCWYVEYEHQIFESDPT